MEQGVFTETEVYLQS